MSMESSGGRKYLKLSSTRFPNWRFPDCCLDRKIQYVTCFATAQCKEIAVCFARWMVLLMQNMLATTLAPTASVEMNVAFHEVQALSHKRVITYFCVVLYRTLYQHILVTYLTYSSLRQATKTLAVLICCTVWISESASRLSPFTFAPELSSWCLMSRGSHILDMMASS